MCYRGPSHVEEKRPSPKKKETASLVITGPSHVEEKRPSPKKKETASLVITGPSHVEEKRSSPKKKEKISFAICGKDELIVDSWIIGNVYEARLVKHGVFRKILALLYPDKDSAEHAELIMDIVSDCPFVATCYGSGSDTSGRWYIFVERLKPFNELVRDPKFVLWDVHDGKCVGMGKDLKRTIGQIGQALYLLCRKGQPHGMLRVDSLWFSEDKNLRLFNFGFGLKKTKKEATPQELLMAMKVDLESFKNFISSPTSLCCPADRLPPVSIDHFIVGTLRDSRVPHDLRIFCDLYNNLLDEIGSCQDTSAFLNLSRWLYRHVIFWKTLKQMRFVELMDDLSGTNWKTFAGNNFLGSKFEGWKERVNEHGNESMKNRLQYDTNNYTYSHAHTIIRFVHNHRNHRNENCSPRVFPLTQFQIFEEIVQYSPSLVGEIYNGLQNFHNTYFPKKGPPSTRGKPFFDFIWKHPLFIDLDQPDLS